VCGGGGGGGGGGGSDTIHTKVNAIDKQKRCDAE